MSTDFVPNRPIPFLKIMNFDHKNVRVDTTEDDAVILTDGKNYLWAYNNPNCVIFTRQAGNRPENIIEAIEDFFDVILISEYEDEFDEIAGEY